MGADYTAPSPYPSPHRARENIAHPHLTPLPQGAREICLPLHTTPVLDYSGWRKVLSFQPPYEFRYAPLYRKSALPTGRGKILCPFTLPQLTASPTHTVSLASLRSAVRTSISPQGKGLIECIVKFCEDNFKLPQTLL